MVKLALTVTPVAFETPVSFASRLAFRNGCVSTRALCSDMDISFDKLVDGDPEAMAGLAELGGLPDYSFSAIRRVGIKAFTLGSEPIHPTILRRETLRVCPACVLNDRQNSHLPPGASMAGRVAWQLRPLRTCPEHDLALASFTFPDANHRHDFGYRLAQVSPDHLLAAAESGHRSPSALERYLDKRLFGGASAPSWMDQIGVAALSRCSEILGAMVSRGPDVLLDDLGEHDLYEMGDIGYAILEPGPQHLRTYLSALQDRTGRGGTAGAQQMFGALYKWLAFSASGPEATPLRDIVRRHIIETMPVGAGEVVLGQIVEKRVVHSVSSAAKEYGFHIKTLRNNLSAAGVVTSDETVVHVQATFNADDNRLLLERLRRGISIKALRGHMNIDRVPLFILTSNEVLRPIIGRTTQDPIYDPHDADSLLTDLARDSVAVSQPTERRVGISAATKRANCGLIETVKLMLAGELTWIGRLDGEQGFRALLLDADELRAKVALPPMEGIVPSSLCKKLGIRGSAIQEMIRSGILETALAVNPVNRCPQVVVPLEAYEKFVSTYISLRDIALQKGHLSPRKALKELTDLGVLPDAQMLSFRAYVFLKSDLV